MLKILSIRGEEESMGDRSVRLRVLPNLNIKATNLKNLIEWENATEPIITCHLTKCQLLQFMERPMLSVGRIGEMGLSGEELNILSW